MPEAWLDDAAQDEKHNGIEGHAARHDASLLFNSFLQHPVCG